MKIHILQHESFESPAVIEDWIKRNGHQATFTKFYEEGRLPGINEIDWLIIMGGPMSTNDEETHPWLKEEKIFIRKTIKAGKKVLGICLGSQLIAASLGSRVFRNKFKEIGWMNVHLTGEAKSNPIFKSLGDTFTVCQWHGDTFDLPPGATLLAKSEACFNQAFVYDERVIGLQFHLEFNEATIKDLIKNCGNDLVRDRYVQTEDEILQKINLLEQTNANLFRIMDALENVK